MILSPRYFKKNRSRSYKMRRAEFRKRRRSSTSIDVDEEQEEEDEMTFFFFPEFDCSACNALISLIDNWFGSSLLIVFFHFLCIVSCFRLVVENEGKFVSLIGLDATKTDAKKGKMKEVPSTHTCYSLNLFAGIQSKSRHRFDLPTFTNSQTTNPYDFD